VPLAAQADNSDLAPQLRDLRWELIARSPKE
jgi:hypothetical protein